MRDIKFRAWDKLAKRMHICGEDVHDEIGFAIETNKAYYYNLQNGCGSLREDSDYVLMQYTGLKDKNGKEIFEGDIVYIIPEDETGVIEWDNERARYIVIYDNIITDFDNWYGKDLEVIGNIYDDKSLLEKGE